MSKSPSSPAQKLKAVEDYLTGSKNLQEICTELKIASKETVRKWVLLFQNQGAEAFISTSGKVIQKNLKPWLSRNILLEMARSQNSWLNIIFVRFLL
ncbi:helix-turn-helix domain-containing protein [Lachnoclostridium phytofermentans]|uniref:helix-turn-helix domain-containing protein n=1 Tax=Lachnoclostridium phytofermentans TaxID=66219 RepID=UPI0026AE18FD|nr:transposase [Lachnoclostridium phytofermentans]